MSVKLGDLTPLSHAWSRRAEATATSVTATYTSRGRGLRLTPSSRNTVPCSPGDPSAVSRATRTRRASWRACPARWVLYPHAHRVRNLLYLSGIGPRSGRDNSVPGGTIDHPITGERQEKWVRLFCCGGGSGLRVRASCSTFCRTHHSVNCQTNFQNSGQPVSEPGKPPVRQHRLLFAVAVAIVCRLVVPCC